MASKHLRPAPHGRSIAWLWEHPPPGYITTMRRIRTRPTKEETAERLVEGARKAFTERSYHGASVEQICEAAGLTRGAFYSGFASKEDLFLALYDRVSLDVADLLSGALEEAVTGSDDPITAFFHQFAKDYPLGREWYILNTEFTLVALRSEPVAHAFAQRRKALRDIVVAKLRPILAKASRTLTVDADLLARALIGLTDAGLGSALIEPGELGKSTFIDTFFAPLVAACSKSNPHI